MNNNPPSLTEFPVASLTSKHNHCLTHPCSCTLMNLQSQILTALSRISTFPSFRISTYRSLLDPLILPDPSGFAPLHYVAALDDINLAQDLVYIFHHLGRTEFLAPLDKQGRTPLHWAVEKGNLRMVKFFTENGLPLNTQDYDGNAPIHVAITTIQKSIPDKVEESREILSYLATKADINVSDINGVSPLHLASEIGDLGSIRVLIQNGAWVDIKDQTGENALFYAVRGGHHETIRALVEEFKINMEMLNEDDESVLDLCKAIGDQVLTELVDALLNSQRINNQKMVGLLNETDSIKYSGQNIEIISSSGLIRFSGLSCA